MSKAIFSQADLQAFLDSPTCASVVGFVEALAQHARGKPSAPQRASTGLALALQKAAALVEDTPAEDKDQPSQRFGNRAFRTWHAKMTESCQLVGREALGRMEGNDAEFAAYWLRSFGDPTRLDFGTGHEVAFLMLMFVAHKLKAETLEHLALTVVPAYLSVIRKLRLEYRLEPAGSHGVWSLDDYHFLPFILGAAQMIGRPEPPRSARSPPAVQELTAQGNMYFEAIADILRSKRGPFQEHSPMLFELSSLKTWEEIYAGLVKMWKGEVLAKFPVAQHFVFGPSLPVTWPVSKPDLAQMTVVSSPFAPTAVAAQDPMKRYFNRGEKEQTLAEYTPQMLDNGVKIAGWTITTTTGRIFSELELDEVRKSNAELDFPFPEMFFGNNTMTLAHQASGFKIQFNAANALKGCKLGPGAPDRKVFKVNLAETWAQRRDADGKPIPTWREDFDWTFTTFYNGDLVAVEGKMQGLSQRRDESITST